MARTGKNRSSASRSEEEQARLDSALRVPPGKRRTPIDLYTLPDFPVLGPLRTQQYRLWRRVFALSTKEWQTLKETPLAAFSKDDPAQDFQLHVAALCQRFSSWHDTQRYVRAQLQLRSTILEQRYLQGDRTALSEVIAVESRTGPWLFDEEWVKAAVLRELRLTLPQKKAHRPSKPGGNMVSTRQAASRHRAVTTWLQKWPQYRAMTKDPRTARDRLVADFAATTRLTDPRQKEVAKRQLQRRLDELIRAKS